MVLVTEGILEIVERIELIEFHEIIDSDHRGYLIDLNLKAYFDWRMDSSAFGSVEVLGEEECGISKHAGECEDEKSSAT